MKRIVILLLISVLSGCELLLQEATRFYTVTLDPEELTIVRGETGKLTVEVNILIDLNDEANVQLYNQPDYVQADDINIPNGLPDGIMTIEVDADAPLGTEEITVQIIKAGKGQRKTFELTITD
jgi:hypothetical protein